jgi:hypothetical protein
MDIGRVYADSEQLNRHQCRLIQIRAYLAKLGLHNTI